MSDVPLVLAGVAPYGEAPVDLRIVGGRIAGLSAPGSLVMDSDRVVNCVGLVALPALVDMHTHLREPGGEAAENIVSGTAAAAAGGYGAVFAMPNTNPVADRPEVVEYVLNHAREAGRCDVHPVGAVTIGIAGRELAPMAAIRQCVADVTVFSDDGHCVADTELMRDALREAAELGAVVAQHAQSPELAGDGQANAGATAAALGVQPWPVEAESAIVARDLALLAERRNGGARLHVCHVSAATTVDLLGEAKAAGMPVTAEVCPHHLLLAESCCRGGDPRFKVNPPLRSTTDVEAVLAALRDGTVDIVATDHAPHPAETKARPWADAPFGMIGLETALAAVVHAMWPHGWTWRDVARTMAEVPAAIGGIAHEHGRPIAVGEPANLCVINPRVAWTVQAERFVSRSRNSPFIGHTFTTRVELTLRRGEVTFARAPE